MNSGLLHVLHDAADDDVNAIADAVHIDLDRVVEKPVKQHG